MPCVNLDPVKGVSKWILFPRDMADGAKVLGYCQEMASLCGRPRLLDPEEGMHERLVVGFDGKMNAF